jgi:hypothetical protein
LCIPALWHKNSQSADVVQVVVVVVVVGGGGGGGIVSRYPWFTT